MAALAATPRLGRDSHGASKTGGISVVLKLTLLVGLTLTFLLAVLLTGSWFYWRGVVHTLVEIQLSGTAATRPGYGASADCPAFAAHRIEHRSR